MIHFYHQIEDEELYEICRSHLGDVKRLAGAYRTWLQSHPEMMDTP